LYLSSVSETVLNTQSRRYYDISACSNTRKLTFNIESEVLERIIKFRSNGYAVSTSVSFGIIVSISKYTASFSYETVKSSSV
jgi:hypothetical protein